jgi:hypothetical protein
MARANYRQLGRVRPDQGKKLFWKVSSPSRVRRLGRGREQTHADDRGQGWAVPRQPNNGQKQGFIEAARDPRIGLPPLSIDDPFAARF